MLTKLGQRNHEVRENPGRYDHLDYDYDYDNDNSKRQQQTTTTTAPKVVANGLVQLISEPFLMDLFSLLMNRS